ncbi:MAG: hypothetical protein OEY93_09875 [Anaerolineae bacterium]|nr:hypothetical protein [Anaerolineae bacterium]
MKDGLRTLNFQGNSKDMVVLFYGLEDQCVWFLSEDDILNEALPKPLRELAQVSNLSRILDAPIKEGYPSTTVFGKEPEPSWCTYYQKADLARQKGDWTQVRDLGKEAQSKGFKPDYGYEYLPFIQAHGAFEEWQQAADLSQKAYQRSKDVQLLLCAAWQSFAAEQGSNPGFERVYKEIHKNLACGGD